MKIIEIAILGVVVIILVGCGSSQSESLGANATVKSDFLLGGQIPFWIIAGESETPSDSPEADAARPVIQRRANEMFDIVIPSSIHWNWIEDTRGVLDFHRYIWAKDWADENGKTTLVQHILWEWSDTKPLWVQGLSDEEFRQVVFRHIQDVKDQIGDVPRIVVINEMTCKFYMENRLGSGITREIFDEARKLFPNTELFLNEHGCPDVNNVRKPNLIQETLNNYAGLVLKLKTQQVDFDRIGFQSYFDEDDVKAQGGINAFVEKYNNAVNQFTRRTGYKLIITELGFASFNEDFKAEFLRAFFKMTLSNSNIEGLFVFHWLDDQQAGTALVNLDGSLTKAGEVFYEVFGR